MINKDNKYSIENILNNDNLIFNLKRDVVFKNCFLDNKCKPYLMLLVSKMFNIDINLLNEYFLIKNSELPSRNVNEKSRYTDLICNYKNYDYIIEMNKSNNNIHLKNMDYLFRQHIGRISNKNCYGKNIFTYLINIDNFDSIGEKDVVYESCIRNIKYNKLIYKNIKVFNINLVKLKYKYYNNIELDELEKLFIIFVEQRIDKIRDIIKYKEIEGVIDIMKRMKFEDNFIATYNREEWEEFVREEDDKQRKMD